MNNSLELIIDRIQFATDELRNYALNLKDETKSKALIAMAALISIASLQCDYITDDKYDNDN